MDGGFQEQEQVVSNCEAGPEMARQVKSFRDRLFGLWVAAQLGKSGASAEIYAAELAADDFNHPGDEHMLEMVMADLKDAHIRLGRHEILGQLVKAELEVRNALFDIH